MNTPKLALLVGVIGLAGFGVFYSRRVKAGESEDLSFLDFNPSDFTLSDSRPYYNPNTDKGSMMLNNPLNIKYNKANNWLGQTGQNSRGFVIFDRPENCYRAGAKILASYAKRGINTVESIIRTWAPPSDNNPTEGYIDFVVKQTGFQRGQKLTSGNYTDLLIALTRFEIGSFPFSRAVVANGVKAA